MTQFSDLVLVWCCWVEKVKPMGLHSGEVRRMESGGVGDKVEVLATILWMAAAMWLETVADWL